MTEPLLAVRGVKTFYGSICALKGVDVDVHEGEIITLIGANGAGKSTLMMTIFANPRAREGRIIFAGRDITDLATHEIARIRIAQAPEGRRIFARMTVWRTCRWARSPSARGRRVAALDHVLGLFPRLAERMSQRGGTLSGGEQQMLAIARALMSAPAPAAARRAVARARPADRASRFSTSIRELNGAIVSPCSSSSRTPTTRSSSPIAAMCMVNGAITMSGTGRELLERPEVRAAYLEGGRH